MESISKQEAAGLFLQRNGLAASSFGKGKTAVLSAIEQLGYVQIDTISVLERAHHHVLFSRVDRYKNEYLDMLVSPGRQVFEYWAHAAAFLPMRDYRFSLYRKEQFRKGERHWYGDKRLMKYVLDRIREEGALMSKDFEEKKGSSGWWNWKESKFALEQLFMQGDLMVSNRKSFQKVYDLPERILPSDIDTTVPSQKDMATHLIESAIRANGFTSLTEATYLRRNMKDPAEKVLKSLVKEGRIQELNIEDKIYYTDQMALIELGKPLQTKSLNILSPFDNALIQRDRLRFLFDFDYSIECYVPAAKRKFGYFVLPVLYGDSLVARIDCKAERGNSIFNVLMYAEEKGKDLNEIYYAKLQKSIEQFALYHGCNLIKYPVNLHRKGLRNSMV